MPRLTLYRASIAFYKAHNIIKMSSCHMSTMKALINLHIAYAKLVRFCDISYHYNFTIIYIFQAKLSDDVMYFTSKQMFFYLIKASGRNTELRVKWNMCLILFPLVTNKDSEKHCLIKTIPRTLGTVLRDPGPLQTLAMGLMHGSGRK